ncbi:MAG: L-tyrosine/L-tryptophan isonitrile synthase family protein [Alphaproteobacteria bacterium]|nr:L-tyrosine/L-tryptophan isonitrile synthase family protein [Alphaproteobacteria bacterium]
MTELEQTLYRLITRKSFRKWALPPNAAERIKTAVALCTAENKPLNFVFEFGGYKLWRLPSAPYPDLAETYMLRHYAAYLQPIAEAYPPGANMYFASDDCVVERMNNIKPEALEIYAAAFRNCLKQIEPELPDNIKMSYIRLAELYPSRKELEDELKIAFADNMKKFETWTPEKKDRMLKRAQLNFCPSGPLAAEDLSDISETELSLRLITGAVYHDAFEDCSRRREFVVGKDRILLFCTPIPEAVAIGTTKASVTKFWTGVGVLENGLEKVLSPSAWEKNKRTKHEKNHFGSFPPQSSL